MMTLERMRELQPELANKSDKEVAEIRDSLYDLAELAFDCYIEEKKNKS